MRSRIEDRPGFEAAPGRSVPEWRKRVAEGLGPGGFEEPWSGSRAQRDPGPMRMGGRFHYLLLYDTFFSEIHLPRERLWVVSS
jgi:hypothetical protein